MINYFNNHYAHVNGLDPNNDEQIKQFLKKIEVGYSYEFNGLLPIDKNAEILEIGSGIGGVLYYLKNNGYKNFFGVDISETQVDICSKFVSEKVLCDDAFRFLENSKKNMTALLCLI